MDHSDPRSKNHSLMPKLILDEFSPLPISKQERHRLRKCHSWRCANCGRPAEHASRHCLKCMTAARERMRSQYPLKRRYHNAKSYWLEGQAFARQILAET